MVHREVMTVFKKQFVISENLDEPTWYPNGPNCIRIKNKRSHEDLVFTFNNDNDWRLETFTCYLNGLSKKGRA